MQMLYDSDSFAVVEIEVPAAVAISTDGFGAPRGGYEILDKLARKDIFLIDAMAQHFKNGVEALARQDPSIDQVDAFIASYTGLPQQPLVLH